MTNYMASIVNCASVVSRDAASSAEIAEVGHCAIFPEQCVTLHEIKPAIRIERGTSAQRANDLAAVVDLGSHSVRVARVRVEFIEYAILPNDRLKLVYGTARGRVLEVSLCQPGHFTTVVDAVGEAIGAAQRGELSHHAVLPREGETCGM
jgi:hypothetical protein